MFYEPLKKDKALIAIVDGYSVGGFFAPELLKLGYQCIHIQSMMNVPSFYKKTFRPENYKKNIIYSELDLKNIISELKSYNVKCVIPGTEPGVELADLLSEALGLLTNGTAISEARRNKFKMIEALKKHNLHTVEHIKSANLADILNWTKQLSSWPVVLKPLKSAGTDKVFFCHSLDDIVKAFNVIVGQYDALGRKNDEVLVESFLQGTQYLINMVSVHGSHILSDIWEMVKKVLPGASVVHDYLKLLPCSMPLKNELVLYANNVLNALEIQYGASHNEIFWTREGPALVEMAARIMGAVDPGLITQCIGRSQLELTLASYLQPERFTDADLCDYTLKKHLMAKFLISSQSGLVKKIKFLDDIKGLPSFVSMKICAKVGEVVTKTVDLLSNAGIVYLSHVDEDILQKDYETISSIECEMFEV